METLVEILIFRDGDSVTIYLNGHRILGSDELSPDAEIVLETLVKLKDLKESLDGYLGD